MLQTQSMAKLVSCHYKQIKTWNSKKRSAFVKMWLISSVLFSNFISSLIGSAPVSPAVQRSASSKCVSPPIPDPGPKAWASVLPGPSNGNKSPCAKWYNPGQTRNRNQRENHFLSCQKKIIGFSSPHLNESVEFSSQCMMTLPWLTMKLLLQFPMCTIAALLYLHKIIGWELLRISFLSVIFHDCTV